MNADEVRREWAERQTEYSPGYYAYYGPNETSEQVRRALDRLADDDDATVLELGCSSGRHLSHLHDHGYGHLHGVDINDDAFDVMASEYPDLAAAGTFYNAAIEDAVSGFADEQFGAVFSVETLQHVHADERWVFGELARITDDLLFTVECEGPVGDEESSEPSAADHREGGTTSPADADDPAPVNYDNGDFPLYYRDWEDIFTDLGMVQVEARPLGGDTFRAFRHT